MGNPIFFDDENIPLVTRHDKNCKANHSDDYDNFNTPNIAVKETKFTAPSSTSQQSTLTLQLRQKVKEGKIAALYRHLNVTGDLVLINLDRFNYNKNTKKVQQF